MSELINLWRKPIYLAYLQPKLTAKMIKMAEKKIGYPLPKTYLDLMRIQNGGYIRSTIKDTLNEKIFGIGPYYPSITDFYDSDDAILKKLAARRLFPFEQYAEEYLCFEYPYKGNTPKIAHVSLTHGFHYTIAKDFAGYLKKLKLDVRDKWVIYTDKNVTEFTEEITLNTELKFDEIDEKSHGYKMFKYQNDGYNLFISPNKVPNAILRNAESRIDEIQDLLNKSAFQYPEITTDFLVVCCTKKEVANTFLKQVKKQGYSSDSLRSAINKATK